MPNLEAALSFYPENLTYVMSKLEELLYSHIKKAYTEIVETENYDQEELEKIGENLISDFSNGLSRESSVYILVSMARMDWTRFKSNIIHAALERMALELERI